MPSSNSGFLNIVVSRGNLFSKDSPEDRKAKSFHVGMLMESKVSLSLAPSLDSFGISFEGFLQTIFICCEDMRIFILYTVFFQFTLIPFHSFLVEGSTS